MGGGVEEESPAGGVPPWVHRLTLLVLLAGLAGLVWTISQVGWGELGGRLADLGVWLLVVLVLEVLITACDAAAVARFVGDRGGFRHVLLAQVAARAVAAVTPVGGLGEVVKTTLLVERAPASHAVAAVVRYNATAILLGVLVIAAFAPLTAAWLDLGAELETVLRVAGGLAAAGALLLVLLARHGLAGTITGVGRRLGLLREPRLARWRARLATIDERLRHVPGGRRDDLAGVGFVVLSRGLSWCIVAVLVHAAGGPLSPGFLAALITVTQVLNWGTVLVPGGLGLVEGGFYALFVAMQVDPAIGVTAALGRRLSHLAYAALGLVLVAASPTLRDTLRRSRRVKAARAASPSH